MKILLILICSLGVKAQNRAANRLKCTDEKTGRVSEACALIMLDYPDNEDNVDFDDFLEPPDFNLEEAAAQITEGSGWYLIKGVFSAEDVELARDRVLFFENPYNRSVKSEFRKNADNHNNYEGLLWVGISNIDPATKTLNSFSFFFRLSGPFKQRQDIREAGATSRHFGRI